MHGCQLYHLYCICLWWCVASWCWQHICPLFNCAFAFADGWVLEQNPRNAKTTTGLTSYYHLCGNCADIQYTVRSASGLLCCFCEVRQFCRAVNSLVSLALAVVFVLFPLYFAVCSFVIHFWTNRPSLWSVCTTYSKTHESWELSWDWPGFWPFSFRYPPPVRARCNWTPSRRDYQRLEGHRRTNWQVGGQAMPELRQLSSSSLTTSVASPIREAIKFCPLRPEVQSKVQRQGVA